MPIYAYGVMLGTSMIVGWFVAMRLAQAGRHPGAGVAGTIYMWTAVWSMVGSPDPLIHHGTPARQAHHRTLLKIRQGGLVAYGGMIGGFLASWYNCRKSGIALLRWADVSAPSVVLGTAITRVGCLLFGCDYGARPGVAWAIRFPGPNPDAAMQLFPAGGLHGSPAWQHHIDQFHLAVSSFQQSYPVHPTQIYESLAGLSLFVILMLIRRYRTFSGQVFLAWVLGYGILRPLIETVRADEDRGLYTLPLIGLQLSTSQIIGLVSVVPAPPWMTSTTNCSCSAPRRIALQAVTIASAICGGSRPSSALARRGGRLDRGEGVDEVWVGGDRHAGDGEVLPGPCGVHAPVGLGRDVLDAQQVVLGARGHTRSRRVVGMEVTDHGEAVRVRRVDEGGQQAGVDPGHGQCRRGDRHACPVRAVGDLDADRGAVGQRGDLHRLEPVLRDQPGNRPHQCRAVAPAPGDHLRVGADRLGDETFRRRRAMRPRSGRRPG